MIRNVLLILLVAATTASASPLIIADFEGDTSGTWTVKGDAFGKAPYIGGEAKIDNLGFWPIESTWVKQGQGSATATLAVCPVTCKLPAAPSSTPRRIMPVHLRCEYLEKPQGIDILQPRLGWRIDTGQSKLETGIKGVRQVAYHILVASSEELLKQDKGDFWDSGKVDSDQSTQVVYAGTPLTSRTVCFWKVKVWTSKSQDEGENLKRDTGDSTPEAGHCKRSKEAESGWSESARWTMGLLKPDDWSAKWISIDRTGRTLDAHDSPMLRKPFNIGKNVKEAQVSICGLGYYEMFLNGSKVGDHVLDPAWTSYHKNALYVTYDIAKELKPGENAIGVQLANGVYNQEFGDAWDFQKAPWRAFPQMLLQLDVVYADGSKERIISDESWKVSTGPIYWDQLRMGVMYDALREQPGWNTVGFDDSKWQPALIREGITGKLAAQMSEPIKVMKTLKPVNIVKQGDVYVVDFGQNIAGWTRLKVTGEAGAQITLDHGTHDLVDGKPLQTEVYTLKGKGVETWEPGFTYHGFRTVKVSGFPGVPDKENFEACVVYTAFDDRGGFECSNPLLNKIIQLSRWSYIGNFVGIPTDCPHREKNGWTGDAQLAAELGLNYYGSEAAYTRWMLDFAAIQAEDGKLPCIVPDGGNGWGTRFLDGPAWESAYLIIPWHIYEYRGDLRILETHYENYKRWLSWYRDPGKIVEKRRFEGGGSKDSNYKNPQNVNQGNIIYYGIGDWPPNGVTPFEITSTAYYFRSAQIIAETARLLGREEEAREYADLAAAVKKAFNREFYDDETGTYSKGSQTGMSCALYFGLVEETNRQRVADNLAASLLKNGYKPEVGCLGSKYLLRALGENGHLATAYKVITRTERPGWGYLAASGRTTLSETIDGGGSDNHVFLGDVAAWMMQVLAGIRHDPAHPGFQRFLIKPEIVADLAWVKAHHDSPYGRIRSEWKKDGDHFALTITVPPNSVAEVFLPTSKVTQVTESGKPVAIAEGVKFLCSENGKVVYEVGSGDYRFKCPIN